MLYWRNRYYDPTSGQFTQMDPIGLAGGLNLYGFAGGDPVNFSDPFGLCPYEGTERTMDASDCKDGKLKDAATLMLADRSGAGRRSLQRIADARSNVEGRDGAPPECAGTSPTACTGDHNNTIYIDVSRNLGSIGASFTHEGMHVGTNQGEVAAWNAALDFFGSLSPRLQTDPYYSGPAAARKADPERFNQMLRDAAKQYGFKP